MSYREDPAWAIIAPDWASPPNFINVDSVRRTRTEAQKRIGKVHARDGETAMQGWKRAYRDGWRARPVLVRAWQP